MFVRRRVLQLGLASVVACGLALVAPTAVSAKSSVTSVEGTLSAINLTTNTLTLTGSRGQLFTVAVFPSTKIERNGRRVSLAAFKIGDRVQAKYDSSTPGVPFKVEAVGP